MSAEAARALEQAAYHAFAVWHLLRARELSTRALMLDPGSAYAAYLAAEISRRRGEWDRAYREFKYAVECGRDDARTYFRLGQSAERVGALQECRTYLTWAIHLAQRDGDERVVRHAQEILKSLVV